MNAVDRVCELILAGKFQRAFPKIKPYAPLGFMIFSLDYNSTQKWSASVYANFWDFYKCTLEVNGIEVDLSKAEKKMLDKAMDFAYDKSMNDWNALRAQAKEVF